MARLREGKCSVHRSCNWVGQSSIKVPQSTQMIYKPRFRSNSTIWCWWKKNNIHFNWKKRKMEKNL